MLILRGHLKRCFRLLYALIAPPYLAQSKEKTLCKRLLKNRVAIYVPSTQDVDQEHDTTEYIDSALTLLSSLFGGATSTQAIGAWLAESGHIVKENVTIVYAFSDSDDFSQVVQFAEYLKIALSQESVAVEIDSRLHLI